MIIIEIVFIIISALTIFAVGYHVGRDLGIDEGLKRAYDNWASRIDRSAVEDLYVTQDVPLPPRVDRYNYKPKRKWKKFNRNDKLKWFFGDVCKVKKHKKKKYPKCEINKMVKELEKIVPTVKEVVND